VASGYVAVVGGGITNKATGHWTVIPGGQACLAEGDHSFAAGSWAHALHEGSFVWADSTSASPLTSTAPYQFTARAAGGFRFLTNNSLAAGVTLAPNGGAWSSISDRNLKENLVEVDSRDILERVAALPMTTWNYKSQDDAIRHIGPMAQDFYAAFGVGEDDTHITTIDADGVALAAIQGLHRLIKERNAEIAALKSRLDAIEAAMANQ
jgi:hypothetical protein